MFSACQKLAVLHAQEYMLLKQAYTGFCTGSLWDEQARSSKAMTGSVSLSHPWSDSSLTAAMRDMMDGKDRWRWARWSAAEFTQLCWDDSDVGFTVCKYAIVITIHLNKALFNVLFTLYLYLFIVMIRPTFIDYFTNVFTFPIVIKYNIMS